MTRNVLSIFKSEADVERLFNQKRNIIHYRRICQNAKTIKTLITIRMHADRKKNLTTEFNILNSENTKDRAKNHKNFSTYLSARLYQISKTFENYNIQNDFAKKTISNENDYTFFNDEKFDKKVNDLINRTCTQQAKMFAKKSEISIQHENGKKRSKH